MTEYPEKLYSLQELRTIADGDESFLQSMIALFISQTQSSMEEVLTSFNTGDFARVKGILHKLKPSVMVMGVQPATSIILQVEQSDLSQFTEPPMKELITSLEEILKVTNRQLREIC